MLKNAYYFSYTFSSLQTSWIECSLLNVLGQKSGHLIPWDPKCAPNQTLLYTSRVLIMIYQWQLTKKRGGKVRSAEFGDPESIAEADTRHHAEKLAVLLMSEIATACNITQISTRQHVSLGNFPYILNTLLLQNFFRQLLLSD